MKLSIKDRVLFKLVVWAALIVWMLLFLAYSLVVATRVGMEGPQIFGVSPWGIILSFIAPAWILFTSVIAVWWVASWSNKKLRGK